MLDVVRFIAAFGIIVLHVAPLAQGTAWLGPLGRFAVPFFTTMAVVLAVDGCRRHPATKFGAYVVSRLFRIYVPFLIWTVLYIVLRDLKYHYYSHQASVPLEWSLLLVGSAHHLWFLPFIFLATFSAFWAAKFLLLRLPAVPVLAVMSCVGALVVVVSSPQAITASASDDGLNLGYFAVRALNMLPAAFLGLGLGRVWQELCASPQRKRLAWLGLAIGVLALALGPAFNHTLWLQHLAGFGAVMFALGPWHNAITAVLAGWGKSAYGIYLAHVFWYLALAMCCSKLHIPLNPVSVFGLMASTLVLSTLSSVLLGRFQFTAWIVGNTAPKRIIEPAAAS